MSFKYMLGARGETGFGSASTAEAVCSNWDGKGCVALVTGAAAGLGYESARVLAQRGAHVVVAVRSQVRAEATATRLRTDVPGAKVTPLELDLSSLASVRSAVDAFKATGLPLNILLLNAGIMACPAFANSKDGFELQWATNHLGHFALTQGLLEVMLTSASGSGREGRVVVLSSMGHHLFEVPGGINFDALRSGADYSPFKAYGVSKLCNILFTRELQRQLAGRWLERLITILGRSGGGGGRCTGFRTAAVSLQFLLFKPLAKTIAQGAATQMLLATAPNVVPGEYYSDCNLAPSSPASHDGELGARLWAFSVEAVRKEAEEAVKRPA
ncbi:hypothetical protein VOLCADRAFT_79467 [Volvox carteri f. nagariensis]|uniref:Uncharacterized protein n=1 Tax=Volvox carteri f. nagariensis TaxID=3068 RepID=D8TL37_VOLCA|nr:uncharacterized protein VOLCADRAFT_79467 [Volvox carteri f. nagariensis]EFJ51803.1 hypothetical protein VOLCADRAFT_79467 [Volvox carteri f. nagariensis]|eukprot:XP_002947213.1 hypothetical protein VOLCADRAFT_79467 [Volvox carteri f. nagariensis]